MLLDEDYDEVFVQVNADGLAGTTLTLKPDQESKIVVPVGTTVTGQLISNGKPEPGIETKAVRDVATRVANPPRGRGAGRAGAAAAPAGRGQ